MRKKKIAIRTWKASKGILIFFLSLFFLHWFNCVQRCVSKHATIDKQLFSKLVSMQQKCIWKLSLSPLRSFQKFISNKRYIFNRPNKCFKCFTHHKRKGKKSQKNKMHLNDAYISTDKTFIHSFFNVDEDRLQCTTSNQLSNIVCRS